jgi:hypothetical protein
MEDFAALLAPSRATRPETATTLATAVIVTRRENLRILKLAGGVGVSAGA